MTNKNDMITDITYILRKRDISEKVVKDIWNKLMDEFL